MVKINSYITVQSSHDDVFHSHSNRSLGLELKENLSLKSGHGVLIRNGGKSTANLGVQLIAVFLAGAEFLHFTGLNAVGTLLFTLEGESRYSHKADDSEDESHSCYVLVLPIEEKVVLAKKIKLFK